MARYVIGCDVGSQGLKTVLVDDTGKIKASSYRDYPIIYPRPTWAEQNPKAWVRALQETVNEVVRGATIEPAEVKAIGLDGYVDAVVPVDEQGEPLRPAFLWMDRRAIEECEEIGKKIPATTIFEITGLNLDPSHVAPKMLWVKNHEPEVYRQTFRFLMPASFIVYHLTGELVVDYSNASSTMLFNVRKRQWDNDIISTLGLDKSHLVPVRASIDIAGELTERAAKMLGLRPGIPVVVGSGDDHAACTGAGVVVPGLVCDIGGTAEPVAVATPEPLFDPSGLVETHCHADPHLWLFENPGFVSGANFRWFRDVFGGMERSMAERLLVDPYDIMNLQAEKVPEGSDGLIFIPAMMGAMTPEWNSYARGVFFGLTLAHGRGHIIRAIMEASAYGLRDIVDRIKELGIKVEEIRAVSGQARSPLWAQIKADVTNTVVAIPAEKESTALGAALFAAVAAGFYSTLAEASSVAVRIVDRKYPREEARRLYEKSYAIYREVYHSLKPVFKQAVMKMTSQ